MTDISVGFSYPEKAENNFNKVELVCRENVEDGLIVLPNAVFLIDGDDLRSSDLVSVVDSETNSVFTTFIFTGAREGSFRCRHGNITSDPLRLAGKN